MSAGLKRAGATALITAAMLCAGCDDSQADKNVRQTLADARLLSKTDPNPEAAKAKYIEAASISDASNIAKTEAQAAKAYAELDSAIELSRQIDQKNIELSRIEWGIVELAQQIRSSNSARAGYQKFDPKPIKDAIEAKLAEARGGANQPAWFAHASASVPTLATVNADITKLEGELNQKKTELDSLVASRTKSIEQSELAATKGRDLKGQEALAVYTEESNFRKLAGQTSVQIDGLKNQIGRLEKQLAVAKGQQTIVNEVITQLQEQITQVDAAWKSYESQASAHQQLSARILGTPVSGEQPAGAVGGTISQKAAEADRIGKEIEQLRSNAISSANNAAEAFAQAFNTAKAAKAELDSRASAEGSRPEAAAWRGLGEVLNPFQYLLRQARAQRVLGELYSNEAASASARLEARDAVQTALEGTGLSVPAALGGADLATARTTALTNANKAYEASEGFLVTLTESGTAQLKGAAYVNRALSFYGWAMVARQSKNEKAADQYITSAKAARDEAFNNNFPLPTLPGELGAPPKPTTTPAPTESTPTSEPASDETAVRTTLETFFRALEIGDMDTVKSLSELEPGSEPFFDVMVSMMGNMTKLDKAMKEKFAAQPAQPGEGTFSMSSPLEDMRKAKITVTGDEAKIESDGPAKPGEDNKLVRKNGKWKLFFPVPKTDEDRQGLEVVTKVNTSLAEIVAGIDSGKYTTKDSVGEAFMKAIFSGLVPTSGPGGGPTLTITPDLTPTPPPQ